MSLYMNYRNLPRRVVERPGKFRLKGSPAPGHVGDPKNKKPGGFRRFERWYKRPLRAWKLYWRRGS